MQTYTKPPALKPAHLEYLDALRERGVTNMFGAAPYLEREFRLSRRVARDILIYWMQTFGERHPETTR